MSLVSLTVVGAFDIVGSILVVALIVTPPAAAHLLTDHLGRMIGLSVLIGARSVVSGYRLADLLDASIAGSMATMAGVAFFLVSLFAPASVENRIRSDDAGDSPVQPRKYPEYLQEFRFEHLREHLRWDEARRLRLLPGEVAAAWAKMRLQAPLTT